MAIKDASKIDKNFSIQKNVLREGLTYFNAEEFSVHGVQKIDGLFRRMEYDTAQKVSNQVGAISSECAGGRVRFITNSPYIAISVKYKSVSKVPNYSFSATIGFDLYSGTRYVGCFVPPIDTLESLESVLDLPEDLANGLHEYTINFPVCSEISELLIGIKDDCQISKASAYTISKPIVFYGSSVTQGACASRPGNTYANMISRDLDCDYINLGFWGNAKGEEEMARYISNLEMSAFIYDYDYNSPSAEHLESTHENMFKIIRERNPALPIIILSAPKYYLSKTDKARVAIIENTYQNALASGDKFVKFIPGQTMLAPVKDIALADNIHPNDIGFRSMANFIENALKEFL